MCSSDLQDLCIVAGKIQTNAITSAKINAGAITAVKIDAGAVDATKIATNAVTADKINAGAVTAIKIDAHAIDATKLAAEIILGTRIWAGDGNVKLSSSGIQVYSGGVEFCRIAGGQINIWGKDKALTTRATRTGTIQCYVGSDGKIYAGGGSVILEESGLTLDKIAGYTGALRLNVAGTLRAYLCMSDATTCWLEAYGNTFVIDGSLVRPGSTWDGAAPGDLGSAAIKWRNLYVKYSNVGDIIFENKWQLKETDKGIALIRPNGSVAEEWR